MTNTNGLFPKLAQSIRRPISRDTRFFVLAVTFWPAEIGPVISRSSGRRCRCFAGRCGDTRGGARTRNCCRCGCGLLCGLLVAILLELGVVRVVRASAARCAENQRYKK